MRDAYLGLIDAASAVNSVFGFLGVVMRTSSWRYLGIFLGRVLFLFEGSLISEFYCKRDKKIQKQA